jgi:hypothetical protein
MKLRDGQKEFSDDEIIRKVESVQNAYMKLVERETQLELRFKTLSEVAGEEATQEALDATPSEEKMTMLRWLDPKGDDFLGSGMKLQEYMAKRRIMDYNRNISSQMRDEQQRRMNLIVRLSVAYDRIRREDIHGTANLESAIEEIIKGEEAKRFDEHIGWMLDRKWNRISGLEGEEAERYEKVLEKREELWAPAIAICREFTDAFKPPPEDRPRYDTWEDMLEQETGMVVAGHDGEVPVWMREEDAHLWGTPAFWHSMRFRGGPAFWKDIFERGVRWRGPHVQGENGYWHREDGEKFPDDEEKFWGNNYHRIFRWRDLTSWVSRQKEPEDEVRKTS